MRAVGAECVASPVQPYPPVTPLPLPWWWRVDGAVLVGCAWLVLAPQIIHVLRINFYVGSADKQLLVMEDSEATTGEK